MKLNKTSFILFFILLVLSSLVSSSNSSISYGDEQIYKEGEGFLSFVFYTDTIHNNSDSDCLSTIYNDNSTIHSKNQVNYYNGTYKINLTSMALGSYTSVVVCNTTSTESYVEIIPFEITRFGKKTENSDFYLPLFTFIMINLVFLTSFILFRSQRTYISLVWLPIFFTGLTWVSWSLVLVTDAGIMTNVAKSIFDLSNKVVKFAALYLFIILVFLSWRKAEVWLKARGGK